MKLFPLQNRVLVKRKAAAETTKSGLIIPSTVAAAKIQEGEVLAIGKGRMTSEGEIIPMTVKPGEVIMFSKNAGTEVKLDDDTFILMSEDDIIAVIE